MSLCSLIDFYFRTLLKLFDAKQLLHHFILISHLVFLENLRSVLEIEIMICEVEQHVADWQALGWGEHLQHIVIVKCHSASFLLSSLSAACSLFFSFSSSLIPVITLFLCLCSLYLSLSYSLHVCYQSLVTQLSSLQLRVEHTQLEKQHWEEPPLLTPTPPVFCVCPCPRINTQSFC